MSDTIRYKSVRQREGGNKESRLVVNSWSKQLQVSVLLGGFSTVYLGSVLTEAHGLDA